MVLPVIFLFISLFISGAAVADLKKYPVADFYKLDKFESIKISPTGEYLAATVPRDDGTELIILRLRDMNITARIKPAKNTHVDKFYWVNDHRVLFTMSFKAGSLADFVTNLKIYGVNAESSEYNDVAFGELVNSLIHNDDHVLIYPYRINELLGAGRRGKPPAKLIDVDTGKIVGTKPLAPLADCELSFDSNGDPRFASCIKNSEITQSFYYKADKKTKWELLDSQANTSQQIIVKGYSGDNKKAYFQIEEDKGPDSIYIFDMASKQKSFLMRDESVDPEAALRSPIDGGVYAIRFNDGLPRTAFIDKTDSFSIDLQKLLSTFPNDDVFPTSFSKDGRLGIYVVSSDIRPAEFYLYDRTTGKASILLTKADWFNNEDLAVMTPVKFKARDGVEINAFVTVPKSSLGKNLPVVINPHGGPFGIFDTWGFDSETQLLANRGYAVMQINFRGSGNYGKAFTLSGYRQWGRSMQNDVTDATKWLIKQGIADPERICIYGASYGAYAALMGAAKEPDLYRCAVGNVGVYDLAKMYDEDSDHSSRARERLDLILGKEGHRANSPNLLAEKIKIPVLLAAGQDDFIAPPEHSKMMERALNKRGIPVDMVIYPKEGHGNYLMANKLDFAERLLAFLDKHIGSQKAAGQ